MSLTDQLLAFARLGTLDTTVIKFNEVLASVEKLLRVTVGESIELEFQTEAMLGNIRANPNPIGTGPDEPGLSTPKMRCRSAENSTIRTSNDPGKY